MILQYIKQLL